MGRRSRPTRPAAAPGLRSPRARRWGGAIWSTWTTRSPSPTGATRCWRSSSATSRCSGRRTRWRCSRSTAPTSTCCAAGPARRGSSGKRSRGPGSVRPRAGRCWPTSGPCRPTWTGWTPAPRASAPAIPTGWEVPRSTRSRRSSSPLQEDQPGGPHPARQDGGRRRRRSARLRGAARPQGPAAPLGRVVAVRGAAALRPPGGGGQPARLHGLPGGRLAVGRRPR